MGKPTCNLCGEPMPDGEEMFKYHGYSGNCPKPPLPQESRPIGEKGTIYYGDDGRIVGVSDGTKMLKVID